MDGWWFPDSRFLSGHTKYTIWNILYGSFDISKLVNGSRPLKGQESIRNVFETWSALWTIINWKSLVILQLAMAYSQGSSEQGPEWSISWLDGRMSSWKCERQNNAFSTLYHSIESLYWSAYGLVNLYVTDLEPKVSPNKILIRIPESGPVRIFCLVREPWLAIF